MLKKFADSKMVQSGANYTRIEAIFTDLACPEGATANKPTIRSYSAISSAICYRVSATSPRASTIVGHKPWGISGSNH